LHIKLKRGNLIAKKIEMKAILIGATGLVGSHILREILDDAAFEEIRIFVRNSTGIHHPKLREFVSPMIDIDALEGQIKGDILFNAIGTTIKKAGSKVEQQRIDRDIPIAFSRIASANGVVLMLNISSLGASMSGNFYLRTKAEMEEGTSKFFQRRIYHFRPGFLVGKRKDFRFIEKISGVVTAAIDPFLGGSFKKYRRMPADKLAKAMVNLSKDYVGKPFLLYYPDIMQLI
jgi:hypothetical protein